MVIQVSPIDAHHAALDSLTFHSFMVAEVTPTAFSTIGWRYFVVFACTNLLLILPCKSWTNAGTLKSDLTLLVGVYTYSFRRPMGFTLKKWIRFSENARTFSSRRMSHEDYREGHF